MFSMGDDIVLCVWRERGEEGGIARDTHYQIAVPDPDVFSPPAAFRGKRCCTEYASLYALQRRCAAGSSVSACQIRSPVLLDSVSGPEHAARIAAVGSLPTEPMTAVGPR